MEQASSDTQYDINLAKAEQKLMEERKKVNILESKKQVELKQGHLQMREVALQAEVTKPAEAQQKKTTLLAEAEQDKRRILAEGDAEATKALAEGNAIATKLNAEANAFATKHRGLADAEKDRLKGLAEAEVITASGQAEAEAMRKKASAYKLYNDAAMASMVINKLPEIVESAAAPMAQIGDITLLSTDTAEPNGDEQEGAGLLDIAAQGLQKAKGLAHLISTKAQADENNPA